eukprot:COSAG06_NODE_2431_length_6889_cov_345.528424_4_plen_33_part_00
MGSSGDTYAGGNREGSLYCLARFATWVANQRD